MGAFTTNGGNVTLDYNDSKEEISERADISKGDIWSFITDSHKILAKHGDLKKMSAILKSQWMKILTDILNGGVTGDKLSNDYKISNILSIADQISTFKKVSYSGFESVELFNNFVINFKPKGITPHIGFGSVPRTETEIQKLVDDKQYRKVQGQYVTWVLKKLSNQVKQIK